MCSGHCEQKQKSCANFGPTGRRPAANCTICTSRDCTKSHNPLTLPCPLFCCALTPRQAAFPAATPCACCRQSQAAACAPAHSHPTASLWPAAATKASLTCIAWPTSVILRDTRCATLVSLEHAHPLAQVNPHTLACYASFKPVKASSMHAQGANADDELQARHSFEHGARIWSVCYSCAAGFGTFEMHVCRH